MLVTDRDGSVDVSILCGEAVKVVSVLSVDSSTVEVGTRTSLVVVARRTKASKLPGSGTCAEADEVVVAAAAVEAMSASSWIRIVAVVNVVGSQYRDRDAKKDSRNLFFRIFEKMRDLKKTKEQQIHKLLKK